MLFVVAYDIPDDPRRSKVARILEDFGVRVQYSVFECSLTDAQVITMIRRLERIVDVNGDTVRIYRLCGSCVRSVAVLGEGTVTADPVVYIV